MIQQKRKCNIDHEKKNNLCRKMHFPIYLSDSFLYNLTFLGTVIRATKYFSTKASDIAEYKYRSFAFARFAQTYTFCNVQCIFYKFIFILPMLVKFVCSSRYQ